MQRFQLQIMTPASSGNSNIVTESSSKDVTKSSNHHDILTPPTTPARAKADEQFPSRKSLDSISEFEFTPDLSQAQLLGEGVWSKVYRSPVISLPETFQSSPSDSSTPPSTPLKSSFQAPSAYAIKSATRSDAAAVFQAEAAILTHIQQHAGSTDHVVPFLGLCNSNGTPSLLFHCADAGTLESLTTATISQPMDETLDLFLHLLPQLLSSLTFLHETTNVIHADIKPANILLTTRTSGSTSTLHPHLADFSAAFLASETTCPANTAGTWTFMAPEQLSRDSDLNTPTFASDVYSLAMTLLFFLCGASPFAEVESNAFRLREAVKMGDAINWAVRDPTVEARLEGLQKCWESRGGKGNLLALVAPGLRKGREKRPSASGWMALVEERMSGLKSQEEVVGLGIQC